MQQIVTTGIVLARTNYGEADRILTVITPDHGKLRLMAKGVRKVKSKLAGGIELFSISNITYIPGKREISTLISTRLVTHYGHIVADLERTTTAYEVLRLVNKVTQEECGPEFYKLLVSSLSGLNDLHEARPLVEAWFYVQLLKVLGHEPNLITDINQAKLQEGQPYIFDFDAMAFAPTPTGKYDSNHIKLLRLLLSQPPEKVAIIGGVGKTVADCLVLLKPMAQQFIH